MARWGYNKIIWWHDEDATRYYDGMMRMQQDNMMTWWGCKKILWWHDEDATR